VKDASRIGEDGESHPRRILRSGENRASKLTRSRSDRVHVVDGESHPKVRQPSLLLVWLDRPVHFQGERVSDFGQWHADGSGHPGPRGADVVFAM
jgi:hypothetical protein